MLFYVSSCSAKQPVGDTHSCTAANHGKSSSEASSLSNLHWLICLFALQTCSIYLFKKKKFELQTTEESNKKNRWVNRVPYAQGEEAQPKKNQAAASLCIRTKTTVDGSQVRSQGPTQDTTKQHDCTLIEMRLNAIEYQTHF